MGPVSEQEQEQDPTAEPPVTGDAVVDQALRELDLASGHPLADRVEAATAAHRVLQERLRAPGAGGAGDGDTPA